MFQCGWIEGSRTFNVLFGATTASVCLLVAVPILWWVLPQHRRWFFSRGVDRHQRIQLAYGLFCMSMAFTDALCRFIPHKPLEWVHPAFFYTTVLIALGIGPRVAHLLLRRRGTVRESCVVHGCPRQSWPQRLFRRARNAHLLRRSRWLDEGFRRLCDAPAQMIQAFKEFQ